MDTKAMHRMIRRIQWAWVTRTGSCDDDVIVVMTMGGATTAGVGAEAGADTGGVVSAIAGCAVAGSST